MTNREWQLDILRREPRVPRPHEPPKTVRLTEADGRFLTRMGITLALAPGR